MTHSAQTNTVLEDHAEYTVPQVAEVLGQTPHYIWHLVRNRKIKARRYSERKTRIEGRWVREFQQAADMF